VSNSVSEPISSETAGPVTILRMNHGKANALDLKLAASLSALFTDLRSAPAVVLTGSGAIFSAGVDLFQVAAGGTAYLDAFLPAMRKTFDILFSFPRPLVAAINGHAIAGGCVVAQTADHRVMSNGSGRIGVTELLVGIPFPLGALEIMRYGAGHALPDMVNLGRTYPAGRALELGLVDELAEPAVVLDRAIAAAAGLAVVPTRSFELTKQELRRPYQEAIRERSASVDADVDAAWKSDAARKAIDVYVEGLRNRPSR
jgi:enoyl-CoA hydratase